eukprot:364631-Chlamydomonas_euryale.AAC.11
MHVDLQPQLQTSFTVCMKRWQARGHATGPPTNTHTAPSAPSPILRALTPSVPTTPSSSYLAGHPSSHAKYHPACLRVTMAGGGGPRMASHLPWHACV